MSVKPVIERPYMQEEWFAVLKAEAEKSNLRAIAETIGYSKTTIGMVLKGQYPGKTDNVAAAVKKKLASYRCPHSGERVSVTICRSIADEPPPTHNPIKMQHWRSCQKCEIRPCEKRKKSER